jgi:isopenicillin-N epimerase
VRGQFNLSPEFIHLATFALASHPRPVREAIQKYRRGLDENPFLVVDRDLWGPEAENLPHKVKVAAAEYVGGRPEEIALTGNTTMGLALVYYGLPLKAGQEVLTTAHDHFSHHESIRLATERAGASMRKIVLFDSSTQYLKTPLSTASKAPFAQALVLSALPGSIRAAD